MHEEALTERGRELFPRFQKFKDFYLVGGTALALQIGHRKSIDFDMFTKGSLPDGLLQKVKRTFKEAKVMVTYNVPGQLNVILDGIKTTFLEYPYEVVEPFVTYQGVPMLSVLEIAATKAFSLGKRMSYKDYVDWYFFLYVQHITLQQVIAIAEQKYGHDFNSRLFLGQLVSFEEIREQPIEYLGEAVSRDRIEQHLKQAVRKFEL